MQAKHITGIITVKIMPVYTSLVLCSEVKVSGNEHPSMYIATIMENECS